MLIKSQIIKDKIRLSIDGHKFTLTFDEASYLGDRLKTLSMSGKTILVQNMTKEKAATILRQAAKEWEEDGIGTGIEKSYKEDANDLRQVAKMLESGQVKKAINRFYDLDTIVRELAPDELYDWFVEKVPF